MSKLGYLTLALGLTCTAAQADFYQQQTTVPQPTTTSPESTATVPQPAGNPKMSDQLLAKKIKEKLKSGWFSEGYDRVIVQANNGIITLTGSVKTWQDKEKVAKEVRNIEGVKGLKIQLAVIEPISKKDAKDKFSQDTYATPADEQLNKKIRDNISSGWLWDSYKDISINSNNGVVTLKGSIKDLSDQQKLLSEIQEIDGVKSVKSELTVQDQTDISDDRDSNAGY